MSRKMIAWAFVGMCGAAPLLTATSVSMAGPCQAPLVEAVGSKYLKVTPLPSDSPTPMAIVVTWGPEQADRRKRARHRRGGRNRWGKQITAAAPQRPGR